jgi:hypothetical protein
MGRNYTFYSPEGIYFISFARIGRLLVGGLPGGYLSFRYLSAGHKRRRLRQHRGSLNAIFLLNIIFEVSD